jgi:hypothetical protein
LIIVPRVFHPFPAFISSQSIDRINLMALSADGTSFKPSGLCWLFYLEGAQG